jgi:hypothetical protein
VYFVKSTESPEWQEIPVDRYYYLLYWANDLDWMELEGVTIAMVSPALDASPAK